MWGDFMTACMNLSNQMREAFCNPAEDEESGVNFRFSIFDFELGTYWIEEIQELMGVFFHTQFIGWPRGDRYALFKVFNLEPVLNIDGQQDAVVIRSIQFYCLTARFAWDAENTEE